VGCDSEGNLFDRMIDQSCDGVTRIVGDRSFFSLFVLRKNGAKSLLWLRSCIAAFVVPTVIECGTRGG
jgi:hypothetical protein